MDVNVESGRDASDTEGYVVAYETRPGRTVLIEETNPDGWIASNITLEIEC
ncbi:hypothetical protein [Halocatena marina]|uniref:Uncharacterized protein n=1 Tax=Halocatena marina TaxID=2934937 RepID=A0ABD5YTZ5_9EURY|nr:hypothetical protein [Halocatena marina]